MKFLIDSIHNEDSTFVKQLTEETTSGNKKYYIEGIFMQANKVNKNGRNYPKKIMENAVKIYQKTIDSKRSLGEMSHPNHPHVNLERASHLIEKLEWDGDNIIGRARILTEMPMGKIAKGLIDEGIQMGVSSRGLGSVKPINGINEVQGDFVLNTIDIVSDPSAHDAFVQGIMESSEWVYENGNWVMVEKIKESIKKSSIKEIAENQAKWFEYFLRNVK